MATARKRQQRLRARRKQAGQQRIELWLEAEDLARLERLRPPGARLEPLLVRALNALKDVTGNEISQTGARARRRYR